MSATAGSTSTSTPAQRAAASVTHPLAVALLTLTFTTGLVDAVSYLRLGRVFSANMTGNVVLLGFGIAKTGHLPVVAPLVSMSAFLVGAALGGRLANRVADRHGVHVGLALAIETLLMVAAAVTASAITIHPLGTSGDTIVALLALAMGVRNATVRKIAVPDLTTTVLTMTLTGLAADSPLGGGNGKGSTRRTLAIVALLTGALTGALLQKSSLTLPLWCAAVLAAVTSILYWRAAAA
jgi:uncharacterized membrane protein YoaK (UPF0700 family)